MERVLIVGQNTALSRALCAVLEDAGYGVAVCSDATLALVLLRVTHLPFVVLVSHDAAHDGPAQEWRQVLALARALPRHAYVLLSSQPRQEPSQWNSYTQAFVPVVPLPFDMKLLLTRVAEAVRRMRFMAASGRSYHYPYPDSPSFHDTTAERDLPSGDVSKAPASAMGLAAREARTLKALELEHARWALVLARAVVMQANDARMRAQDALTHAQTALAQARAARDVQKWRWDAPMRDLANVSPLAAM